MIRSIVIRLAVVIVAAASGIYSVIAILDGLPPVAPDASSWILFVAAM